MKVKNLIAVALAGALAAPVAALAGGGPAGMSAMGTGPTGGVPNPQSAGEPRAPERNGAAPKFSEIDQNHDGRVSRAEWNAYFHGSASSGGASGVTSSGRAPSTTGVGAGPDKATNRVGEGSATATTPSTSGEGNAQ